MPGHHDQGLTMPAKEVKDFPIMTPACSTRTNTLQAHLLAPSI